MGKHTEAQRTTTFARLSRHLPLAAFATTLLAVSVTGIPQAVAAAPKQSASPLKPSAQTLVVSADVQLEPITREAYEIIAPPPKPVRPAVAVDPGSAQAIAKDMVLARGWDEEQFSCLYSLWSKESGWRVNAENRSSGAYGIPQALPGNKMASAGADWQTNPATQITWGLGYISGRYGTPCGAWDHSQRVGWY